MIKYNREKKLKISYHQVYQTSCKTITSVSYGCNNNLTRVTYTGNLDSFIHADDMCIYLPLPQQRRRGSNFIQQTFPGGYLAPISNSSSNNVIGWIWDIDLAQPIRKKLETELEIWERLLKIASISDSRFLIGWKVREMVANLWYNQSDHLNVSSGKSFETSEPELVHSMQIISNLSSYTKTKHAKIPKTLSKYI